MAKNQGTLFFLALGLIAIVVFVFGTSKTVNQEVSEPVVEEATEVVLDDDPLQGFDLQKFNESVNNILNSIDAIKGDIAHLSEEGEMVSVIEPESEVVIEAAEVGFMDCGNGQVIPSKGYLGAKVAPCGGLFISRSKSKTKIIPGKYKLEGGYITVH